LWLEFLFISVKKTLDVFRMLALEESDAYKWEWTPAKQQIAEFLIHFGV
jgi:hypothetical protein